MVILTFSSFSAHFLRKHAHHATEVHGNVMIHAIGIAFSIKATRRLRLTMAASTSKEISFRWWSFLQSVKDEGKLDGNGFPASSAKDESKDTLDTPIFDEYVWSDAVSKESSKHENPLWFFDTDDTLATDEKPTKQVWSKEDDEMLDMLLGACGGPTETEGDIPDLQWSYSFDEPSWDFEAKQGEVSSDAETMKLCTFFSQEFQWDEAKFFDTEAAFTATSTESGSSFTGSDDDDVSTLTPTTGLYSVESLSSPSEEMSLDKDCWYRAKIASLFAPRKKAVIKLKQDDIEVWPTKQASSHSIAVEAPLLVQVSQEELARRMFVMEERQAKRAQIEALAQSPDPEERKDAANQLKELWLAAYYKKRSHSSGNLEPSKENIPEFV